VSRDSRYSKQIRFGKIGEDGQDRIHQSKVLVVGCGALGSVICNTLARAGVGHLRIVDRDFLEMSNLQRQTLFDEDDVKSGLPKSIAAVEHLRKINSGIDLQPFVDDVNPSNIGRLCEGVDLILDGTDNFETRFLINDASIKFGIPWVYGGCLGAGGQSMTVLPRETACLNCLMLDGPPPPGTTATCDSAGVLAPIIDLIASIQCCEALKLLVGDMEAVSRKLTVVDMWDNFYRQMDVSDLRNQVDCPTCKNDQFKWLTAATANSSAVLCGRNAVQLRFANSDGFDFERVAKILTELGTVNKNDFMLKFATEFQGNELEITVFEDGRAIIYGTDEISIAKSAYARFIGN